MLTAMVVYRDVVDGRLEVLLDKKYVEGRRSCKAQEISNQVMCSSANLNSI